jgi:hypothetical protein
MKHKVQGLMQKISYAEQDMELQKQILVTIPTKDEDDIEEVITNIARLKEKVKSLKLEVKEVDPDEYEKMIAMESASNKFSEIAKNKKFEYVKTFGNDGDLSVVLADGVVNECLVIAKEETGEWILLTMDGEVLELAEDSVKKVMT